MSPQSHVNQVFKQFCTKAGLRVHQTDASTYFANVSGESGKWPILFHLRGTRLLFESLLPITISRDKRQVVMEYVTRANFGLPLGHFEMDLDDGEVTFTTSVELADGKLTHLMLAVLVAAHFHTVDRYLSGLYQVLFSHQTPLVAILACEADPEDIAAPGDLNDLLQDVDVDRLPKPGDD